MIVTVVVNKRLHELNQKELAHGPRKANQLRNANNANPRKCSLYYVVHHGLSVPGECIASTSQVCAADGCPGGSLELILKLESWSDCQIE